MNRIAPLTFVAALPLIMSCDAARWPTDENYLKSLLAEQEGFFLSVEAQMRADKLESMSIYDLEMMAGDLPAGEQPGQESTRFEKYIELIGESSPYIFELNEYSFSVAVPVPEPSEFSILVRLKRDTERKVVKVCDAGPTTQKCGDCAIQIDDEWSAHWIWVPDDPRYTDEKCPMPRRIR